MSKEKIYVSRKILADVGRGIYRTPANAIKELVSNAFDACATWVKISTNVPYFDVFTCEDNGEGMTFEELRKIFKRIGSSTKRAGGIQYNKCKGSKRPIIGKIGIGLLAVSQICDKFTIISKKKKQKEGLKATIDLLQFEREKAYLSGEEDIALGEYELSTLPVPQDEIPISYTKIIMESLKEGFQNSLKEEFKKQLIRPRQFSNAVKEFGEFIVQVSQLKNFKSLATYDYMIWELGIFCPLKYLETENQIFPSKNYISEDIERLKKYNFKIFIDGLEIFRSILFEKTEEITKQEEEFKIYKLPPYEKEVAGEKLKFHGYIYSQRKKIQPTELQGILIRIKDVAIGNYDKTILKYPREEGPIFSMVSGEIFVEEGLETALNIDRNSFNETHPHYIELQNEVHKFFKETVVQDIRERSKQRRKIEKQEQITQELNALSEKIKNKWNIDISFKIAEKDNQEPFYFDKSNGEFIFYTKTRAWSKSEKERLLQIKSIIALYLLKLIHNIDINEITSELILSKK